MKLYALGYIGLLTWELRIEFTSFQVVIATSIRSIAVSINYKE